MPHDGAVHASMSVYVRRLPRHSTQHYPLDGGDVDNYAKMVLDALNDYLYLDDKQVVSLTVEKKFCRHGENPRTEMEFLLDLPDGEEEEDGQEDVIDLTV